MQFRTVRTGPLSTNCYLVYLEDKKHLYIIDPGADPEKILAAAAEFPAEETAVLLTHAHIDHVSAAGKVCSALGVKKVYLNKADEPLYFSPENEIFPYYARATDLPQVSEFSPEGDFSVFALPGHSPGGSGFLFRHGGQKAFFVGDTVFESSIGRTDLWGGDYGTLIHSIKSVILAMEEDLELFCGHGSSTTVGRERIGNPYLI